MEKIYSQVDPEKLLHIVVREADFKPGRVDLIDVSQFLQCSILNFDKGKTFQPHKHIWKWRKGTVIAQESWVVIKGKVECTFYDIDNTKLATIVLNEGDASFTLEGGHNYLFLEDNCRVFEYKTGPYEGQALDKEFIQ